METATEAASSGIFGGGMGVTLMYIVLMIAIFYFLLIRPQKKREKQTRNMLNEMRTGDEIVTIGGICGKIVSIKDDTVLVETGADRTKIRFEKSAIKTVLTVHDDEEEEDEE
jgi:preprotein translocase subunit YajC